MAEVVGILRIDLSGVQPLYDMINSVNEVCEIAGADEPLEIVSTIGGFAFEGNQIARLRALPIRGFLIPVVAEATPYIPLFAVEFARRTSAKVTWRGAWPHFSARDDDPDDESMPALPSGECVS